MEQTVNVTRKSWTTQVLPWSLEFLNVKMAYTSNTCQLSELSTVELKNWGILI